MKNVYSEASKKYWATVPHAERSRRASLAATAKWSKVSKKDRLAHAMMMVEKRLAKGKKVC